MLINSIANQGSIYHWARDHRVHHKHSETDADPHNATRGFFFSHVGWLLVKKHPSIVSEGNKLDFSDLERDGFVMFQKALDPWFALFMCFVFPAAAAKCCWGEHFWNALWVAGALRYVFVLHCTWLVNSAAHYFGDHPYDDKSRASRARNTHETIRASEREQKTTRGFDEEVAAHVFFFLRRTRRSTRTRRATVRCFDDSALVHRRVADDRRERVHLSSLKGSARSWPAENPIVSFFSIGEGWHNWHHKYPYDYAASEFGITSQFNPTKLFIDGCFALGIVTNCKRATNAWERAKVRKTGAGKADLKAE